MFRDPAMFLSLDASPFALVWLRRTFTIGHALSLTHHTRKEANPCLETTLYLVQLVNVWAWSVRQDFDDYSVRMFGRKEAGYYGKSNL